MLRSTGRILNDTLRPGDFAARYGGEEFAVLLQDTGETHAARIGERILEAFREHPWPLRKVTLSIGLAEAIAEDDPASLIGRADRALYASKHGGRDRLSIAVADAEALATPA